MTMQKIQNVTPVTPIYDEDNLPDELFYPEELAELNAGALCTTTVGEILEPSDSDYDEGPDDEVEDGCMITDGVGEIIDPEEATPFWDVFPEEEDTPETEML
ncbi:MAG: hypothetical protein IJV69_05500 [Kiritimatiellae bacterium]|nr:hypothetical protein [Kiritimatiellia bacterium]